MEIDPSRNDRHIEDYAWDVCPMCVDPDQKTLWGRFVHRWKYIRGRSTWKPRIKGAPITADPCPLQETWLQRFKKRRQERRKRAKNQRSQ